PYPEAASTASAARPAAGSSAPAMRVSMRADELAHPGQVINGPALSLYHGEVHVLDLPDVTRIAVGSGEGLPAQVVASNQVVLIGQAAGTTSLRIWTRTGSQFTYTVAVRSFDTTQIVRDVRDMVGGDPGISVKQVDGHVVIEGDDT